MKKTLIALAVLAASGAAMAQSSVTIYGVLDIGVGKVKGGQWGLNNGEGYTLPALSSINPVAKDGFNSTSVIGFRGTEDLGGGLKANFNLQTGGIDLSGASPALAFSRESWVGLEGGFGAVQFGRSSSVAAKSMGAYDLNGTSYSSAFVNAGISAVTWYGTSRRSDQIQYATPNFGGFVGRVSLTPKGDTTANGLALPGTAKARWALAGTYANGPISVTALGETKSSSAAGLRTAYAVGAMYDLSVVKIAATYNRRELVAVKNSHYNPFVGQTGLAGGGGKGWTLGVSAPIGAANIGTQYASNMDTKGKAFEVFANYALSKRTRVYADYGKLISVNAAAAVASTATTQGNNAIPSSPYVFGVGVVHTF